MATWVKDKKGNKCSVEHFGSLKKAQQALDSLKGCKGCINCSECFDCHECFGCDRCVGCWKCNDCHACHACEQCIDCHFCIESSDKNGENEKPAKIPKIENIHKAVYTAASQPKALEMGFWHICEKRHCRAGWTTTLAGKEGIKLDNRFGPCLAAMMIYEASGYKISPVRFFDSNEDALADMKRLARK